MITSRRKFLKQAGGAILLPFMGSQLLGRSRAAYFAVHGFIENNPDAVFIMKTNVDNKTNASAIKQAGLDFAGSVFVGTDDAKIGIPFSHTYVMKPNLTAWRWDNDSIPFENVMGVITDVNFVEGIIEHMKTMGISADDIHLREVNGTENMTEGGYGAMAVRTGADVQVINESITTISQEKIQWIDVPEGLFFTKIPYLSPVNAENSWLLNIAKFTLEKMAAGGIYDHVGGGFHRAVPDLELSDRDRLQQFHAWSPVRFITAE